MNTPHCHSRHSWFARIFFALAAIVGYFNSSAVRAQIQIWVPPVTTEVWHEGSTEQVWVPPVMGTRHVEEVSHIEHIPEQFHWVHHPEVSHMVHHDAVYEVIHHELEIGVEHIEEVSHIVHHPAQTHTECVDGYWDSYWVDDYAWVCDVYCEWIYDYYTEGGWWECWEENCREEWVGGHDEWYWVDGYCYEVTDQEAWDEKVIDVEEHDNYYIISPAYNEYVLISEARDEKVVDRAAYDEKVVDAPARDVKVVDVPAHDEEYVVEEGHHETVQHPGWWETIVVTAGHWRDITPQVTIVSRDKFIAGSFVMPQEASDLELEIVNVSTSETMGRYGGLLGGGSTRVYNSVRDILSDADLESGGQAQSQRIWLVRDSSNPRKVNFYTCFNAVGSVEVRLHRGSQRSVTPHQLIAAADFGDWIAYVDNWVKGVGFGGSTGGLPSSFAFAYNMQPLAASTSGGIHALTRAPLIPLFNVIAQAEGMEAFALGMFEGAKAGFKDDKEMAEMIINGYLRSNDWLATQVANEIIDWQTNPLRRSRELMAMCVRICEDAIFAPLASANQAFSSWDNFKSASWAVWDQIKGNAVKQYAAYAVLAYNLAGGIVSWADDFANRMMVGAEKTAFQARPWHTSELASDLVGFGRLMAYSGGYYLGYLGEQAAMGIATGGVTKIGTIIVKGGAVLGGQLVKKSAFAVATRSAVLKKSLRSLAMSADLRVLVDSGIAKVSRIPISGGSKISVAEFLETALSRPGFNRGQFNLQTVVDRIAVPNSNLQKLVNTPTSGDAQVWVSLGEHYNMLGDATTANSSRGWIEFHERTLTASGPVIVEDRATMMLTVWAGDTTAVTRAATSTALEGAALRAMQKPNSPWIVGQYIEMKAITRGEGYALEAHHIAEKRHLIRWNINPDTAPAVVLARPHHRTITTDLLNRMPTGQTYTKAEVWTHYQQAYADVPEWLDLIRHIFETP